MVKPLKLECYGFILEPMVTWGLSVPIYVSILNRNRNRFRVTSKDVLTFVDQLSAIFIPYLFYLERDNELKS
jgi:hypothetical protein